MSRSDPQETSIDPAAAITAKSTMGSRPASDFALLYMTFAIRKTNEVSRRIEQNRKAEVMVRAACADGAEPPSSAPRSGHYCQPAHSMGRVIGRYFDAIPFALGILDRARYVLFVNAQMAEIAGHSVAALDGTKATLLFPELEAMLDTRYRLAAAGQTLPDTRVTRLGRSYVLTFSATYDRDGTVAEMMIGATDITREARLETRLRQSRRALLASLRMDHLTGLLNRRGLERAIALALRHGSRHDHSVALLIIDIDCFKAYNERFGHVAADRCLIAIANAIGKCRRQPADAIGRLAGDKFAIALPEADISDAIQMAEECRTAVMALAIDHPGVLEGTLTVSVGATVIAGTRDQTIDAARIACSIGAADRGLYEAKNAGRNAIRFHPLPPEA